MNETQKTRGQRLGRLAPHRNTNNKHRTNASSYFKRERLPSAPRLFDELGIRLTGGGEWRDAICPFHVDTKPSLRVRIETGAYRCMACSARGGDVVAFYMALTGVGFVEAAKRLGAWGGL